MEQQEITYQIVKGHWLNTVIVLAMADAASARLTAIRPFIVARSQMLNWRSRDWVCVRCQKERGPAAFSSTIRRAFCSAAEAQNMCVVHVHVLDQNEHGLR